jgi:hypothetical protein
MNTPSTEKNIIQGRALQTKQLRIWQLLLLLCSLGVLACALALLIAMTASNHQLLFTSKRLALGICAVAGMALVLLVYHFSSYFSKPLLMQFLDDQVQISYGKKQFKIEKEEKKNGSRLRANPR